MRFIKICNPKLNSEITISLEDDGTNDVEMLLRRIIQDCLVKSQLICDITVGEENARYNAR